MRIRFPNKRTTLLIVGVASTLVLSFGLLLSPSISVSLAISSHKHAQALTPAEETATVQAAIDTIRQQETATVQAAIDTIRQQQQTAQSSSGSTSSSQPDNQTSPTDSGTNGAGDSCSKG